MRYVKPSSCLALVALLVSLGCSGSDAPTSPSPGPSPSPAPGPGPGPASVVVSVLGERGNQSFSPNPVTASRGQTISWRNNDSVTHRIRFNDGSLETENILPGQTSTPRAMPSDGANYHCEVHPGMIGSVNTPGEPPPDCTDPDYC